MSAQIGNQTARKHGMHGSPEYNTWCNIRARCNNPKHPKYYMYGAKGIRVCDRWNDFRNFYDDMGERPSPQHSIDRIEGTEGYAPWNCRWATKIEQSENRPGFNRKITMDGRTQSLSAWCRELGLNRETIKYRLDNGWTVYDSFNT